MKTKFKVLAVLTAAVMTCALAFGCAPNKEESSLSVYMPMGAPALAMAKMMAEDSTADLVVRSDKIETTYDFTYKIVAADATTPDNISASVKQKKADIAILPVNAAAALLGTGGASNAYADEYKIVSVNTHGNLFMLRKGSVAEDAIEKIAVKNLAAVPGLTLKAVLGKDRYTDKVENASAATPYLANIGDSDSPLPFLTQRGFDAIVVPEPACLSLLAKAPASLGLVKTSLQDNTVFGERGGYAQAVMIVKKELANTPFVTALTEKIGQNSMWLLAAENGALKNATEILRVLNVYKREGLTVPFSAETLTTTSVEGCSIYTTTGAAAKKEVLAYLNKIKEIAPATVVPTEEYFFI